MPSFQPRKLSGLATIIRSLWDNKITRRPGKIKKGLSRNLPQWVSRSGQTDVMPRHREYLSTLPSNGTS